MSDESPPCPETAAPAFAKPGNSGRFQTGVRGLIVAVACCGVVSWAARSAWETLHPALAGARGLHSSSPSDRVNAARQLQAWGPDDPGRAIPPLVAALRDAEAEVRIEVCRSLGEIGGAAIRARSAGDAVRGAVAGLIGTMKDREPAVRLAATRGLATITIALADVRTKGAGPVVDLSAAIAALAAILRDQDEEIRLNALFALMHCGPLSSADPPAPLVAALEDRSARNRAMALKAMAAFPRSLDPWLTSLLRRVDDGDPEVATACGEVFARDRPPAFSAEAIPGLVAALGSRSRGVRYHAARALSPHASDPRAAVAVPALLALLREPIDRDRVRRPAFDWIYVNQDPARQAAAVLGKLAPGTESAGEVLAALIDIVRTDYPLRRAAAADALGAFGPAAEPAVPALMRVLRDDLAQEERSNFYDGASAARALGRIAPGTRSADETLAALIEVLDARSESRSDLLYAAIKALPVFGAKAACALPQLRAWQGSSPRGMEWAVDQAVAAIEDARPGERSEDRSR